ncbi:MAG: hypothetical protein ACP5I8_12440, partial [Phycisphaerae bacterium]
LPVLSVLVSDQWSLIIDRLFVVNIVGVAVLSRLCVLTLLCGYPKTLWPRCPLWLMVVKPVDKTFWLRQSHAGFPKV